MTARQLVTSVASLELTLATAESCTGGLLGAAITEVPGASGCYAGGIIAYDDEIKRTLLSVPPSTLETHGAVSKETAVEMARGVAALLDADLGVSIMGIAGPAGGTPAKPVGTVHIAVLSIGTVVEREYHFEGDRQAVRKQAVEEAISLVQASLPRT